MTSTTPITLGPTTRAWSLDRRFRYVELLDLLTRHHRGGTVLELGAGPGGLGPAGWPGPVVTADLDPEVRAQVRADGTRLPFADDTFGTSVAIDVLEHLPAALRPALVAELHRVTSGVVVVGAPIGVEAEATDRAVGQALTRRGAAVPDWLEEHLERAPYPAAADIGPPTGAVEVERLDGIGVTAHRAMTVGRSRRGVTRLERAVPTGALSTLARAARAGTTYRQVSVHDRGPVTFSVVMATHERADRLPAAVASVLAQDDPDLELIIFDDGSTDATPEVAARLAAADARVRVVRGERPSGSCGRARNRALPYARGTYVAFCDDDVAWRPDHLRRCREALAEAPACTTRAQRYLPDGRPLDVVGRAWGAARPDVGDVDANCMVVRRDLLGTFPDGGGRYGSEDVRLARKLFDEGVRFAHVAGPTVDYTFNLDSHCYVYEVVEGADGAVSVASRPVVRTWRQAAGRVLEAVEVRARRFA